MAENQLPPSDRLPNQLEVDGGLFPWVVSQPDCADINGAIDWITARQSSLREALAVSGAILFRGFPLETDHDFDAFVSALGGENFPYQASLSNAVRINRTERVFTANEAPATTSIFLHHEMAQTPIFPSELFFFCEQPAETGGATPICRSDLLLNELRVQSPDFVNACEQKGLKYTNVMPAEADFGSGMGRSWASTLGVETRQEAEARLRDLGYSWVWLDDGSLQATTPLLPAVREFTSGRPTFFNQLIAATKGWKDDRNEPSRAIQFGDGTPLDADGARLAAELADQFTFDIPWQAGDVAWVDNHLVMHARRPFTGVRKVLASLVK